MIKMTYYKNNNYSQIYYFCDNCFEEIKSGSNLRSEATTKERKFDLCSTCKEDWDRFGELEEELKGETND